MKTNGLILAAGLSGRMGEFKPLMRLEGKTLIENSIDSVLRAEAACVTVVLGYRADEVEDILRRKYSPRHVRLAYNAQYAETDMLYSVKAGIRAMPKDAAFFLLPGDMPAVSPQTFCAVKAAMLQTGAKLVFPELNGRRKHPPLISADCIPDILAFTGGGGLRGLWGRYGDSIVDVPVDDPGCAMDNDTQKDFAICEEYMKKTRQMRNEAIT